MLSSVVLIKHCNTGLTLHMYKTVCCDSFTIFYPVFKIFTQEGNRLMDLHVKAIAHYFKSTRIKLTVGTQNMKLQVWKINYTFTQSHVSKVYIRLVLMFDLKHPSYIKKKSH